MRFLVSFHAPCHFNERESLVFAKAEVAQSTLDSHEIRIDAAHRLLDRRGLLGQHHRRRDWQLVAGLRFNSDVKVDLSANTHQLLAIRAEEVLEAERVLAKLVCGEDKVFL